MNGRLLQDDAVRPARPIVPGVEVVAEVGAGGQGVVWRGIDERSKSPVAIKVLTLPAGETHVVGRAAGRGEHDALRAFRTELLAVAQLRHPNVIRLCDFGADGALEDGTTAPYVVMEWADGTIAQRPPRSYEELLQVMRCLLSGLAHAHAAGIVHCDVKPSNLLVARATVKLGDFGVAKLRRDGLAVEGVERRATWAYAAPELWEGATELVGPWTDLYAVGVTAYELVCGTTPFQGTADEVRRRHLHDALPELTPRFSVPVGLLDFLDRLCAKEPAARFQRAAEALAQLETLHGARLPPASSSTVSAPSRTTLPLPGPTMRLERRGHLVARPLHPLAVPPSWRAYVHAETDELGVEGRLLPIRSVPVVGRDALRDALWSALVEVAHARAGKVVLLRGPSGVGKSHLAQWLVQVAHESGAANVLVARHTAAGSDAGLRGLWLRHLGWERASMEGIDIAVEQALASETTNPIDRFVLARFLRGDRAGGPSTSEVQAASVRLLLASVTRPTVLWMDDLHTDGAAIGLVERLVADAAFATLPLLVCATVREDAVEGEALAPGVLRLAESATSLTVDGLDPDAMHELLEGVLGLAPVVARQLSDRAAGSPLFAVQSVTGWAEQGFLHRTEQGLDVPLDAITLPTRIDAVWRARIELLLQQLPERSRVLLQLAAVLGLEVVEAELEAAAEALGVGDVGPTVDLLLARRLVVPAGGGFRFVHTMLRETLLAMVAEGGEVGTLHRAAAVALAGKGDRASRALRRARHHRAAGDVREAIELYGLAIVDAARRRADDVTPLISEARAVLGRLPPEASSVATAFHVSEVVALVHVGRYAEAAPLAAGIDPSALTPFDRVGYLCATGRMAWAMSRGDATTLLEDATRLAGSLSDVSLEARARLELAHALQFQRDVAAAEREYLAASEMFHSVDDLWGEARALIGCAITRRKLGESGTEPMVDAALALFERAASPGGVLQCLNERGLLALRARQFHVARTDFREGLRLSVTRGERTTMLANLGLVDYDEGRFVEARATMERALVEAAAHGGQGLGAAIRVDVAACAAALGDWDDCARQLAEARAVLEPGSYAHPDTAERAEQIAERAAVAGQLGICTAALTFAQRQYEVLGRPADAARVRDAMEDAPGASPSARP